MTSTLMFILSFIGYFMLIIWLYLQNKTQNTNKVSLSPSVYAIIILVAIIGHFFNLWLSMSATGGLNLALGMMFSLIMLCVALTYFLYNLIKPEITDTGIIILPVTLIALTIGQFLPGEALLFNALPGKLKWHVLFAIPAYIIIFLAFAQAILLIIGEKQLRQPDKNILLTHLPAIDSMDRLLHILTLISFLLITINIILGIMTVLSDQNIAFSIDHHFIFTMLSWLCLIALLAGRYVAGWRTDVAAKWTISAFLLITLAYFGTRFVTQVILT